MGITQITQQLFKLVLMRIGIAVEAKEIDRGVFGGSLCRGGQGRGEGGPVGVFVGVEEDVGSVVFVVAVSCESVIY